MNACKIGRCDLFHAGILSTLQDRCFNETWDEAALADLLAMPGAFAFLAEDEKGGEPMGFILCRGAADECEVITLAVLPDFRRRGVAAALLGAALDEAGKGGAKKIFLEVAEDNSAGRSFYEALKFKAVGRREKYYKSTDGERRNALVLVHEF